MGLGERKEKRGHGGGQKQSYELDTKGRSIDRMFLKDVGSSSIKRGCGMGENNHEPWNTRRKLVKSC